MPYVQRDSNGKIIGEFANFQEGWAEEWLDADASELLPSENSLLISQKLAQIESLKQQYFSDTVQMGAIAGNEEDIAVISSVFSQITTLKSEIEALS